MIRTGAPLSIAVVLVAASPAGAADCLKPASGVAAGAQLIDSSTGESSVAANVGLLGRWDLAACLALPLEVEARVELLSLGPDFFGGTDAVGVSTLVVHGGVWGGARLPLWQSGEREAGLRASVGAMLRTTRVTIDVQGTGHSTTELRMVGGAAASTYLRLGRLQLALRGAWATPRADGPSLALEAAFKF